MPLDGDQLRLATLENSLNSSAQQLCISLYLCFYTHNKTDMNQLKSLYQELVAAPSILTGLKGCQSYTF